MKLFILFKCFEIELISKMQECTLCKREIGELTFHHLIPRKMHDKKYIKKMHPQLDFKSHGIYVCKPCHQSIHLYISHRELASYYYSVDKLLQHKVLQKFISFNSKQRKNKK